MPFPPHEREALLELRGIGPTVLKRLEQIGVSSCADLRRYDPDELATAVASMLGSSCWKNSPQARHALDLAIAFARENDAG
ncbi:MAG: helix-hairpin-helix domain-containing protein [Planctomycetota bacterium]